MLEEGVACLRASTKVLALLVHKYLRPLWFAGDQSAQGGRYSLYLLYWYESTNTDAAAGALKEAGVA